MIENSAKRKLDTLLALENDEDFYRPKKINIASDVLMIEKNVNAEEEKPEEQKVLTKSFGPSRKYQQRPFQQREGLVVLRGVGLSASLYVDKRRRRPMEISALQALISDCLLGNDTPFYPYKFFALYNIRYSKVTCLILDGLGVDHFKQVEVEIQKKEAAASQDVTTPDDTEEKPKENNDKEFLTNVDLVEVVSPASYGGDVVQELTLVTLPDRELKSFCDASESLEDFKSRLPTKRTKGEQPEVPSAILKSDDANKVTKLDLLLNVEQMNNEGFPLPSSFKQKNSEMYSKFVYTKDEYGEVTENSPMVGLDCEMCQTTKGPQLTYVALIREDHEVIYKSYVKTKDPVTNYLTQFSGVYSHDLSTLTTSLADVQKAIREIIPKDCILVGHSLNHDLIALQMIHPYVIDTSVCYNLRGRGAKSKLKLLTSIFLNQEIQTSDVEGHCPEEDARASLELAQAKLQNGRAFGDVRYCQEALEEISPSENVGTKQETVKTVDTPSITLTSLASKHEKSISLNINESVEDLYTRIKGLQFYAESFHTGKQNDNVVSKSKKDILENNLAICHCDITKSSTNGKKVQRMMNKQMTQANKICSYVYNGLPEKSLLVVICPGNADVNGVAAFKYKNKL